MASDSAPRPTGNTGENGLRPGVTRRRFLKRGAVAGALAAGALAAGAYVAPSFSTVTAQRAYTGITAPCDCKDQLLFGDWVPGGTTLENDVIVQDLASLSVTHACTEPKFYQVSGLTLPDVWDSTMTTKPVFTNPDVYVPLDGAGYFEYEYKLSYQVTPNLEEKTTCECDEHTHDAWKYQVTIYRVNITTLWCTLWYPKWVQLDPKNADHSKLTPSAKTEWARFIGKLEDHEEGHRDVQRQSVEDVVRNVTGYQATAIACTKERARELALEDVSALYKDHFAGIEVDQTNYDAFTNFGVNQGAALDTSK